MNDRLYDFEQFMKRRELAARAYVSGDFGPLSNIITHLSPATFFGPRGGVEQGGEHVFETHQRGAEQFEPGAENHFEILQMAARDGIGYWVGLQRATARIRGEVEAMPFDLRVTEVFRREGDDWKLVHRHADPLAKSEKMEK